MQCLGILQEKLPKVGYSERPKKQYSKTNFNFH